jgi:hypothetical protein
VHDEVRRHAEVEVDVEVGLNVRQVESSFYLRGGTEPCKKKKGASEIWAAVMPTITILPPLRRKKTVYKSPF